MGKGAQEAALQGRRLAEDERPCRTGDRPPPPEKKGSVGHAGSWRHRDLQQRSCQRLGTESAVPASPEDRVELGRNWESAGKVGKSKLTDGTRDGEGMTGGDRSKYESEFQVRNLQ